MDVMQRVSPVKLALERHYTPAQLAEKWSISQKLVRAIFADEPGVLRVNRPEKRNKRGYCSMRIPESLAITMHQRMSQVRS
jgi:hypothetical protein